MDILELHMIRNYPLSRLNRDENGSPKCFIFGGFPRASVSSQCIKRAIRMYLKQSKPESFGGIRTKFFVGHLKNALVSKKMDAELALQLATAVGDYLSSMDTSDESGLKTKTALFYSKMEIEGIASLIHAAHKKNKLEEVFKVTQPKKGPLVYSLDKNKAKLLKGLNAMDMVDVALFGRMVAGDSSLKVEAATSFAHPFSVHASSNEPDFFSAVEESPLAEESGAAHIGETEYNSACYYSYVSINLDEFKTGLLAEMSEAERTAAIEAFIEACIIVTPPASKHGMFAATQPYSVIGLVRKGSFEISLANAFEKPLSKSSEGYSVSATARLKEEWEKHKTSYGKRLGLEKGCEIQWTLGGSLDNFIGGLLKNV